MENETKNDVKFQKGDSVIFKCPPNLYPDATKTTYPGVVQGVLGGTVWASVDFDPADPFDPFAPAEAIDFRRPPQQRDPRSVSAPANRFDKIRLRLG